MAMVESGLSRMGETLYAARKGDKPMAVKIVGSDFLKEREDGRI